MNIRLAVIVVVLCPLAAFGQLNLDFEVSSAGLPVTWVGPSSPYTWSLDTRVKRSGQQSLKLASATALGSQAGSVWQPVSPAPVLNRTVTFSGLIRTQQVSGHAEIWAEAYDSHGYSVCYAALGQAGPTGTTEWQRYTISLKIDPSAIMFAFGSTLFGSGTAWFDDFRLEVDGEAFPERPPFQGPTEARLDWIRANTIRFDSLDPDASTADLQPLKKLIGDARIVGLGEATHGTSEFFQMKARIVAFLAREMGFTIFAIEANMPEAYRLNDYVLHGRGDPRELIRGMYFWTWNTQEVLDMVEWMRRFNLSGQGRIQFLGFDMQNPYVAVDNVWEFLQRADPDAMDQLIADYLVVLAPRDAPNEANWKLHTDARDAAQRVRERLEQSRAAYVRRFPASEVDWAIQNSRIVEQAMMMHVDANLSRSRDASMAANVGWILDQAPPGSRMVLWAHNGHVYKSPGRMGRNLSDRFGKDYVNLGFSFYEGTYTAVSPEVNIATTNTASPCRTDSVDFFFHATGIPRQILDLRLASATDPNSAWLYQYIRLRHIGSGAGDYWEFSDQLPLEYDALIFLDQTTASQQLPFPNTITSPTVLPSGTVGSSYAYLLNVLRWEDGFAWTLRGGALPPGLSMDMYGRITGKPTQAGTYVFTSRLASGGQAPTRQHRIDILPAEPRISAVVNGASFQPLVSPGAWISIFGTNLAWSNRTWRTEEIISGALPLTLDGVSVTINGLPAAVHYISSGQVNVQVPEVQGATATVRVTTSRGVGTAEVPLAAAAPRLFAYDAENRRYAAAQHADYTIAGKAGMYAGSTPARPGEVVLLYGTGCGAASTPVLPGYVVPVAVPLLNPATAQIGQAAATVEWAGISAAGLCQFNVRIPAGAPDGDAAVTVEVAGQRSQEGLHLTIQK